MQRKTIKITDIITSPDRQRQVFDEKKLQQLKDSIRFNGLLHPIILRDDGKTLIAGERRLRAIQSLHKEDPSSTYKHNGILHPTDEIPFTLTSQLEEDQLEEMELHENLIREDLTWQELAKAQERLHKLRTKQRGEWSPKNREGQTLTNTIEEILGRKSNANDTTQLRDNLVIAEHLDDPEVLKAKDKKEALKIIKEKAVKAHRENLSKEYEQLASSEDYKIHHSDCISLLKSIENNSIDIILTDPPYGIDAQDFGPMADNEHEYDDSEEYFTSLMEKLFPEYERVLKDDAHLYIFCDITQFLYLYNLASLTPGWKPFRTPLIWNKGDGMLPWPEQGPRRCYEAILYIVKGKKKVNSIQSDIISVPKLPRPNFGAEKPWQLYSEMLKRSSLPGDTVLDTFAGAGPVIEAAKENKCKVIACDMNKDKYNFMLNRLNSILNEE